MHKQSKNFNEETLQNKSHGAEEWTDEAEGGTGNSQRGRKLIQLDKQKEKMGE